MSQSGERNCTMDGIRKEEYKLLTSKELRVAVDCFVKGKGT